MFSTFTQRSLGETDVVEIAPAAELAASTASWPRSPRCRTPTSAPTSRSCCPSTLSPFLSLAPADAEVIVAAEEEVGPALADHWQDVCAAFHDTDAHHLYVRAGRDRGGAGRSARASA